MKKPHGTYGSIARSFEERRQVMEAVSMAQSFHYKDEEINREVEIAGTSRTLVIRVARPASADES